LTRINDLALSGTVFLTGNNENPGSRLFPTFGASFVATELESNSARRFVVSRRRYTGDSW